MRALGSIAGCCIALVVTGFGASTVRDVDFKNFTYAWQTPAVGVPSSWKWLSQTQHGSIRLVNGRHSFGEPGEPYPAYVEVLSTTYGSLAGTVREEAAVDLLYSTGGTAHWHYLYVYELADGSAKLLGTLRSGSRADGGLVKVEIQKNQLVLDFADTTRRRQDCCSEGWVRVRYVWREGRFVETGGRSYGDFK